MSRKILLVLGLALIVVAAALFFTSQDASAQGGEECDGPCPQWIVDAWSGSGHADTEAEAFNHWNEDDPQEVSANCAKCHSEGGYLDFLGVDGSEAGVVDAGAPIGTTVTCTACHNPVTVVKDSVVFPSGVEITGAGPSSRCMECHQGRESSVSVNAAIDALGIGPDDVSADLRFRNIHYFAAAATLYGSEVHSGYEYEGMVYQTKFEHAADLEFCIDCHDPHSLEVKVDLCATCHSNVSTAEDLHAIRMPGSKVDYDGDGVMEESIRDELEGMQELLYASIQAYASDVAGMPIVYDAHSYPYFFGDADGNGEVNGEEGGYASWTPRLLEAAYNFQAYEKDPGAFAHNGEYYAQLMYDSLASLNEMLPTPMDMSMMHRNPPGHFDGTGEPFRHWDEEGEVSASCVKCHTAEGLPFLNEHGVTIAMEPSTSLACATCHVSFETYELMQTNEVEFPSGAVLSFGEGVSANLCLNCHQGRDSGVGVANAIGDAGDDDLVEGLRFRNVHYFAAGATLFGADAGGLYQYEGKEYAGRFAHVPGIDTCAACHDVHQLTIKIDTCATCHAGVEDPHAIRMAAGDYDGDAAEEGVSGEIETMHEMLLAAIQAYAADTVGTPIGYESHSYPYFFIDGNGDGMIDAEEGIRDNAYATFTPALLRAAYNYQYVAKDPGAFAHNGRYVGQVLYDSIEALGGDVSGLTRP